MKHLMNTIKNKNILRNYNQVPSLFVPRILFLILLYSIAFALLLIGLHLFHQDSIAKKDTQSYSSQKVIRTNHTKANTNLHSDQSVVTQQLYLNKTHVESDSEKQLNIAKNIIRLHVIANSDSDADQRLKLQVRDAILSSLQNALHNADSVAQANEIIMRQQYQIQQTAYQTLASNNRNYPLKISLTTRYFPARQYGDFVFPAGNYKALCVEIGKADGHNWWCVLFPNLCFVNETTAKVPAPSKNKLKQRLSSQEYNSLMQPAQTPEPTLAPPQPKRSSDSRPELRSALLDWFR